MEDVGLTLLRCFVNLYKKKYNAGSYSPTHGACTALALEGTLSLYRDLW